MQSEAFTALVHGVYVVTTRVGEKVNGMTAAWVSQVSLNPLMVMVSIAPARYSHTLIKEAGIFAINVDQRSGGAGETLRRSARSTNRRSGLPHRPTGRLSCPRRMLS
jgi:flavin reductase (DIM6/NTAB) family NADH-FMN oxidoreductase RutF